MTDIAKAGTYRLGDREVKRMGYGAMQLAGPGVFGPPRDRDEAIAVLREAVASGVNHIDTSDYYGPFVTNEIIREALHPYADDLVIVTKVGARRGEDGVVAAVEPAGRPRAGGSRQSQAPRPPGAWRSSTCGSWATAMARPKARSPTRSKRWRGCSATGWCGISGSAT